MHRAPCVAALALLVGLAGCQEARPYTPRAARPPEPRKEKERRREKEQEKPAALDAGLHWQDGGRGENSKDPRIEFVHEGTQAEVWNKLTKFWNDPLPGQAAAAIGLPGLGGLAAAAGPAGRVLVKVPLGLDDPLF